MYDIIVIVLGLVAVCICQSVVHQSFRVCEKRQIDVPGFKVVHARSEIQCAAACMRESSCGASNFAKNNQTCEFFKDSHANGDCSTIGSESAGTVLKKGLTVESSPECLYTAANNLCRYGSPFNETACRCSCDDGFSGNYCQNLPRDCSDFSSIGYKDIYLPVTDEKLDVVCQGDKMYILQFFNSTNAFTKYKNSSWDEFKSGINKFGEGEYWIGNEDLHSIITKTNHTYMIEMYVMIRDNTDAVTEWITSKYYDFVMGDEANNYTIHFSGSWVPARGSLVFFNNTQFRTIDYNSDGCVTKYGSAWWYQDDCQLPPPITGNYSILDVLTPFDEWYMNLIRT